jgi:hypothetical protein
MTTDGDDRADEADRRPIEVPVDPSELVARLRARLAEHGAEPRGWALVVARLRAAGGRVRVRSGASRRRRLELSVGALVCVVAVGGVLIMRHSGTATDRPRAVSTARPRQSAPSTATRPVPPPVLARLPAPWRRTCRSAPALDRSAPSALVCAPVAGTLVEVRPATAAERAALLDRLAPLAAAPGAAACARGPTGPPSWSRAGRPHVVVGHVACFRSTRGAEIAWTVDDVGLVLRAVRADGDARALFTWWAAATF